jgi:hypothetical protein
MGMIFYAAEPATAKDKYYFDTINGAKAANGTKQKLE